MREKHYTYGRNSSLRDETKQYFNYQNFTPKYSKY